MWAIRMLSGNHAGQVFPLKEGRTLIGRGTNCQIRFNDLDVSKEHALIYFENQKLTLVDNQSRNGTYVNGILTNKAYLKRGDKVSFNQTLCDVIYLPTANQNKSSLSIVPQTQNNPNSPQSTYSTTNHSQLLNSPAAGIPSVNTPFDSNAPSPESLMIPGHPGGAAAPPTQDSSGFLKRYIDEVVMPGVYHLGSVMEFKLVIGLFMIVYAVLVTALSTIPMLAITSDSIQIESRRRALTIARNLANLNQQALLKDMESAVSTQTADLEEGVSQAFIIRQGDGSVIAPAVKAGTVPSIPFIETARREQKELIKQIDSSHIAVAVPLSAFNPDTSTYAIKAFAIVIYDMGSLAIDDGRTLSLFFQTLIIALALGFLIYILFSRFIEFPINELNKQIDYFLKTKSASVATVEVDFPLFQNLISNVNTLMTRVSHPESQNENFNGASKDFEIINIIKLIGYAGIAINSDQSVLGINGATEQLLNMTENQIRNQPITLIPDQALQKNLYDLMEQASRDPAIPSRNELEFGGVNTEINCQAVTDKGSIKYFIVTIIPLENGSA